jgi:lysophosphatidate acyltransferase
MGMLKSLKFYAKLVVFGGLIAGCGLYGVIASIALRIIGKKEYAQYTVAKVFYRLFSTLLGVRITLRNGERLDELPAVVILNHQSALDILILGRVFQPGYTVTAKKVLKYFPFLGWFMLALGTFFLDRLRGEKARKVLERGLNDLKSDKRALFIFPEGSRLGLQELDLLPFKKGAFHLARQAGIPVIPVVVSNYSTLFNAKTKTFERGEIIIEVLEPMPTTDLHLNEDVTAFAAAVRDKMLEAHRRIGYLRPLGGRLPGVQAEAEAELTDVNTDSEVEVVDEQTPLVQK